MLFAALGKDPVRGAAGVLRRADASAATRSSELAVKATPLLLIALGLAVCFRANVWNIGAEGQFIVGAVAAGGVALLAGKDDAAAGSSCAVAARRRRSAAWPGRRSSPLLRDRFNANEILVSLMLVYVAELLLGYLVYGPWKDPEGYNFPQTDHLRGRRRRSRGWSTGSRVNIGAAASRWPASRRCWVFLFRTYAGFQLQVGGLAPRAARYAGFSSRARAVDGAAGLGRRWPAWRARSKWPGRSAS